MSCESPGNSWSSRTGTSPSARERSWASTPRAPQSAEEVELGSLFVDPGHLRQGIGSALLEHAMSLARSREFKRMTVVSDPHAAEFNEAMGAVVVGEHPTGFPGRVLPILEISL